jgi:hypothetical protein
MTRMTDFLQGLPHRMEKLEAYAIEIVLALSNLWAAVALLSRTRDPFTAFQTAFALASRLGSEEHWACVAFIAGATKLVGLGISPTRFVCTALVLRIGGLGISGAFWFLLGLSTIYGNPHTLFGFPIMLLGISAWWLLIRFPTLPDRASAPPKWP